MTESKRNKELKDKLGKAVKTIDILKSKLDNALKRIEGYKDYIKDSLKK